MQPTLLDPPADLLAHVANPPLGAAERTLSGVYTLTEADGARVWRLHVDVDGPSPLLVVSGQVWLSPTEPVHFVARLTTLGSGWSFVLEAPGGLHQGLLAVQGTTASLTLSGVVRSLRRESADFRSLDVRLSIESGKKMAGVLNAAGDVSDEISNALRLAGIGVKITRDKTKLLESEFGTDTSRAWDNIELHDAMLAHWAASTGAGFRAWALVASTHIDGAKVGGLMFDGPSSPDDWQRQGFALFAGAEVHHAARDFNPWSGMFPDTDKSFHEKIHRFTFVHELGHALNLAHSWQKTLSPADVPEASSWLDDPDRPGALSWMNYPQYVTDFFKLFQGRFDGPELAFLRHAPDRYVMMGSAPFFLHHGLVNDADTLGALPLRIKVISSTSFQALEPPVLSLLIYNTSDRVVRIPGTGAGVLGRITDASLVVLHLRGDRVRMLRPYLQVLDAGEGIELHPGDELAVRKYVGGEPGLGSVMTQHDTWPVRVAVISEEGLLGLSDPIVLEVGAPPNREMEVLQTAWSTDPVARLYRFGGSHVLTGTALRGGAGIARRSGLPTAAQAGEIVRRVAIASGPTSDASVAARGALVGALDRERRITLPTGIQTVDAQPLRVARVALEYSTPERREQDPLRGVEWMERSTSAAIDASKPDIATRLAERMGPEEFQRSLPTGLADRLERTIKTLREIR